MGYAVDTEVIKPPSDKRQYRVLHLPNGLCAVLVHDPEIFPEGPPDVKDDDRDDMEEDGDEEDEDEESNGEEDEDDGEYDDDEEDEEDDEGDEVPHAKQKKGSLPTKKAAAAMCVGMGSFSDPTNARGLAHFLEHMLFMGSSKFPDENEYDSYLSKHGGSSNAYTETEYTCYHFEVNREYLKGALDRFSQFFISPLVKAEAMDREVLAVDSEFNQVLQSDSCRLAQLQCHTAPPNHPFNGFFWGNKKSLTDAMESGVNMRDEIFKLYRKNYYGGMMKLVVIGGEPLDVLEDWVIGFFGNVRDGKQEANGRQLQIQGLADMPIWKPGKLYRIEAVRDVHVLDLTWTLPCLHDEYLKKPEDYLAHLLGHEGKGSLLSLLKEKGWASTLSAGVGEDGTHRSSVAYIFVMSIRLTDSGLEKIYDIIDMVYQYIKLLRLATPQEWIFKELQDIGNMEFRFAEEQPQDEYAASLAENLLFYSEKHIIYGDYAFEIWDDKLVQHILDYFKPQNMRVDVLSKSFNKELPAVQHEPWFHTWYTEEDIPSSHLELWKEPPKIEPSLNFPAKNEFIPQNFALRISSLPNSFIREDNPRCILDLPSLKLWYKLDSTFKVPRANTYFLISLKDGYNSIRHSVLFELYAKLLRDELNEILYQAGVAKLETSLCIVADKLELKVYGFNDKLAALLHKILSLSSSFVPKEDRFLVIKEDMERAFRNTNMKPLGHSTYLRLQILREVFWDVDDKLSCLVSLSLDDLKDFIPRLLSELYIEGLCHGNLSEEEALGISDIFMNIFPVKPLPVTSRHQEHVICLPSGAKLVKSVPVKNKFEVNSVVELYFQIEPDLGSNATRMRALADLFSNIVEEPYFNQLRTKEQLGYTVECGPRMTYRVLGFCFRVQSSEYNPIYLLGRIDYFINGLQKVLNELDDESFESHRSGLIEEKLEKDPSLTYETDHYWTEIVDKRYVFDVSKREAEELKTIQKKDVIQWYKTYLRPSSPKCRQLGVHVWGCNAIIDNKAAAPAKLWTVIDDIPSFKTLSKFYDCIC